MNVSDVAYQRGREPGDWSLVLSGDPFKAIRSGLIVAVLANVLVFSITAILLAKYFLFAILAVVLLMIWGIGHVIQSNCGRAGDPVVTFRSGKLYSRYESAPLERSRIQNCLLVSTRKQGSGESTVEFVFCEGEGHALFLVNHHSHTGKETSAAFGNRLAESLGVFLRKVHIDSRKELAKFDLEAHVHKQALHRIDP